MSLQASGTPEPVLLEAPMSYTNVYSSVTVYYATSIIAETPLAIHA